MTWFVVMSTTDTDAPSEFCTYSFRRGGFTCILMGAAPTAMLAITESVRQSITATELLSVHETYTRSPTESQTGTLASTIRRCLIGVCDIPDTTTSESQPAPYEQ